MLSLLGLFPSIPLLMAAWCCLRGLVRPNAGPIGAIGWWAAGIGWLVLWSLPAVAVQVVGNVTGLSGTSFSVGDAILSIGFPVWVLAGGSSVIEIFEATAKEVSGHRQSTMIDNWPYFVALTYAQLALGGAIVAWCWRSASQGGLTRLEFSRTGTNPTAPEGLTPANAFARRCCRTVPWMLAAAALLNSVTAWRWPWWGT